MMVKNTASCKNAENDKAICRHREPVRSGYRADVYQRPHLVHLGDLWGSANTTEAKPRKPLQWVPLAHVLLGNN
jgi:hypothetical protein